MTDQYKQDFLAYYYNKEAEWGREVVASYKWHDIPPGAALLDFELGKTAELTHYEWITDTTVDDGQGWGYIKETEYKSVTESGIKIERPDRKPCDHVYAFKINRNTSL